MEFFWHTFLYQPVFNGLIWIYNNWTDQNLGWAVVYLTLVLRVALLPITLINERNKVQNEEEFLEEIKRIDKEFAKDEVLKKEEIRRILRKRRISPWAKSSVLAVQALVLVLLYQVFVRGITGEKILQILYPWIDFPGVINTNFFGFELGQSHDIIWPGIVTIWLFLEIYFDYRKQHIPLQKADLLYFIFFPSFVFVALWILPMVKSLFILTSMIFSVIIAELSRIFFRPKKKAH
ncbi:MAG TPA: hypothetical protein DCY48_02020 [Candidatus Magasanikbacteria bacterium]|nr:MAG: hypothetical protein A3I74_00930 [Candidatus Magasanikbacteria bacterium RIFCSPLOWO2_02_FULL_47_16]OGH79990.1 MAG: hypothetical protein A3C10_02295 [Candidatus Magasanikbacteria bacterium RIFCSPHIGHO2_02_FULL_48_18]OGH83481.1 MAG: hypothetical protein A3G08_04110 [Candidatus Magasanikbacteria bacterium RIFCSPLOWO2_12_FULL_47_9b]HAZ28533.1 hypothetical protein [Candidatus Magasanikbacteria bacterium]